MSPAPVSLLKKRLLSVSLILSWVTAAYPAPPASGRREPPPPPAPPAYWGDGWGFVGAGKPDPNLPRVLLIGDSILNGYRTTVTRELAGKANVDVWLNPIHQASPELHEQLKVVLVQGPYDVVHFNMGLHGFDAGRSRIPEDQFKPLTRKLVETIRAGAPGAILIWASSTPMSIAGKPTEIDPASNRFVMEHNKMAAEVMAEFHIRINDLYTLMRDKLELGRGDTVHWSPEGSVVQGKAVAAIIEPQLKAHGTPAATQPPVKSSR